jgi:Flp pilus assembly pilin Flp
MSTIVHFMMDDSGATAFEYGLIAAAAGLAISAIMPILRNT